MTKRTQGRPPRNSGVNGRQKLIEATRSYLQSNRKLSLTRTEIAQGCGVTPALISYYFKDKRSLLDAVTKPLLRSYRSRLSEIYASMADPTQKMRDVIRLLLELNTDDAFLVDHVLRRSSRDDLDAEDRAAVEVFRGTIASLVVELVRSGEWEPFDPELAETALWGICRALGETLRHDAAVRTEATIEPDLVGSRTAFVYATFTARAARQGVNPACR